MKGIRVRAISSYSPLAGISQVQVEVTLSEPLAMTRIQILAAFRFGHVLASIVI
jgi:hypothetical protein